MKNRYCPIRCCIVHTGLKKLRMYIFYKHYIPTGLLIAAREPVP